ncbi:MULTISPECIES: DUF1622 domain-containing protein [Cryobacterium]|uniref:DUF1622 domain-containing protein n=1 Tax=Cryobacterium zongtaii TaxID=1259217 RepID=A0A2S3ZCC6_9MICO|nr:MULTISPECIES: DUF1622 domain-containing protein [Cryobacterium]ASD23475.1 hypothetical protein B7495_16280 [Cryobacterium sp. LW097]POH63474.1 DUF1622 domain-containing protein [Cryobacterium zongtaii]POH63890.1 DUF1622 domain-containing protein [Cryobacterium zongtaii]TFC42190.1 DUF1622 domain-containing protein [Cryobacterium sp. TMN-39-2]TFC56844.1 DUF1622 domain-containing protein [Cryobacterium sp. TMB3-1-2]
MTFEAVVEAAVRVVEVVGAAIMVFGGLAALVAGIPRMLRADTRATAYQTMRRELGRAILLGLEVLIVADIIRTIVVEPTVESVLVLGAIVIIRVLLSFSLEVEMDGVWPWARWRMMGKTETSSPPG